jgi:protein SCO1/2
MTKKSIWALLVVVALPLLSYWLVNSLSRNAIAMPPHYYADTVVEKVVNGKQLSDTQWHRVSNIRLTNQLGEQVELDSLGDKVIVMDFFFTRCPSICPGMTRNMKRLQDMMHARDPRRIIDTPLAHFVSISIDPERDSAPVLKRFADKYGVDHERWWMLTGDKEAIYRFAIQELKLGVIDGNGRDTLFEHSPKFVLLDKERVVRGYYNGLDTTDLLRLSRDVVFLSLEKDRKKPSTIFTQLKQLWPIFIIAFAGLALISLSGLRKKNLLK